MKNNLVSFLVAVSLLLLTDAGARASGPWDSVLRHVPDQWRADVAETLKAASAEWNDGELVKALGYYTPGTQRHRAVCFLIANMRTHQYVDYVNPDDPLNPLSPEGGEVNWVREYVRDYATITSELLIENVEWAFVARERFPWCRDIPESVFFDYVLPYRSTDEPLVSWRPAMFRELEPLVAGLSNTREVTTLVNRLNSSRVRFTELYYRYPEDRDIPSIIASGVGRCEDMSNVSNYSLRAVGVPTTSDFTPYWPKTDNNHAWNTIYDRGEWHSFMGCEGGNDMGWDSIKSSTFAKVYRNTFSAPPIMGPAPDGTMPPRLMRATAVDVTREYSTVSDIRLQTGQPNLAAYLCVFNFGAWQAVAGAWTDRQGQVCFRDVGNHEILYCAAAYVEDENGRGRHCPVLQPFVLHEDGSISFLNVEEDFVGSGNVLLSGWSASSSLQAGTTVTLFTYVREEKEVTDDCGMNWAPLMSVETQQSGDRAIAVFTGQACENRLYILSDSDDPENLKEGSRPFVWKNGAAEYY